MKILVTGFEPFHNDKINSSWETIKIISQEEFGNHTLISENLPVSFIKIQQKIASLLKVQQPDLFLMFGQAGNCEEIRLERVAINLEDASIPDNDNCVPNEIAIDKNGESAYFSNLPLKELKNKLDKKKIPIKISNTAGTFVCNCAFYHALQLQSLYYPNMKVGFIHVPLLEEQKRLHPNKSTLPKELLEKYVIQIIRSLLELL